MSSHNCGAGGVGGQRHLTAGAAVMPPTGVLSRRRDDKARGAERVGMQPPACQHVAPPAADRWQSAATSIGRDAFRALRLAPLHALRLCRPPQRRRGPTRGRRRQRRTLRRCRRRLVMSLRWCAAAACWASAATGSMQLPALHAGRWPRMAPGPGKCTACGAQRVPHAAQHATSAHLHHAPRHRPLHAANARVCAP